MPCPFRPNGLCFFFVTAMPALGLTQRNSKCPLTFLTVPAAFLFRSAAGFYSLNLFYAAVSPFWPVFPSPFFLLAADFFSSFLVSGSFTPSEALGAFSPVWPLDGSTDGFTAPLPAGALGSVSWIPGPLAGPAPGSFASCFDSSVSLAGASTAFVGISFLAFSSFFFLRP